MKADAVTVKMAAPAPAIVVKKGLSLGAGARVFGYGSVFGGVTGFAAGFVLAQAIYSDEREREQVKRTVKITACACGGGALLAILGAFLARH